MPLIDTTKRDRIRELNNAFRKSFNPRLGRIMLTAGVDSLPSDVRAMAIRKTATFDAFSPDNDPHGEHDFGSFELAGRRFRFAPGVVVQPRLVVTRNRTLYRRVHPSVLGGKRPFKFGI